jgi:hypothetical protein
MQATQNKIDKYALIRKIGIYSIDDLKRHYYQMNPNGHWFDKDTMRFFKCRVAERLEFSPCGKIYFYTSEKGPMDNSPRRYSVREYDPATGNIETVGLGFCAYKTLAAAMAAGRKLAG